MWIPNLFISSSHKVQRNHKTFYSSWMMVSSSHTSWQNKEEILVIWLFLATRVHEVKLVINHGTQFNQAIKGVDQGHHSVTVSRAHVVMGSFIHYPNNYLDWGITIVSQSFIFRVLPHQSMLLELSNHPPSYCKICLFTFSCEHFFLVQVVLG